MGASSRGSVARKVASSVGVSGCITFWCEAILAVTVVGIRPGFSNFLMNRDWRF